MTGLLHEKVFVVSRDERERHEKAFSFFKSRLNIMVQRTHQHLCERNRNDSAMTN